VRHSVFNNVSILKLFRVQIRVAFSVNPASSYQGQVLLSTGTSTIWTSTSSLGIGSSLTGGTSGFLTRWLTSTTLGTGVSIDDGTVAGVNATSSSYTFNVQGGSGVNPFNVASSTGTSMLSVNQAGNLLLKNSSGATKVIIKANTSYGEILGNSGEWLGFGLNDGTDNGLGIDYNSNVTIGDHARAYNASMPLHITKVSGNSGIRIDSGGSSIWDIATNYGTNNNLNITPYIGGGSLVLNNSKLSVGSSTPTAMLTVVGTTTNDLVRVASSSGATYLSVLANGNVGIGRATPTSALDIVGTSTFYRTDATNAYLTAGYYPGFAQLFMPTSEYLLFGVGSNRQIQLDYNGGTTIGDASTGVNSSETLLLRKGSSATSFGIDSGGNVWDFVNNYAVNNNLNVSGNAVGSAFVLSNSNKLSVGSSTPAAMLTVVGTTTNDLVRVASSSGTSIFSVLANGRVGVGTSSPIANFTVASLPGTTPFVVASSSGQKMMDISSSGTFSLYKADGSSALTASVLGSSQISLQGPSSGYIGLTNDGLAGLNVDFNGNVRLGSGAIQDSAAQTLHVRGASNAGIRLDSGASTVWDFTSNFGVSNNLNLGGNSGASFVLSNSNKLSVGSSTPNAMFTVVGTTTNDLLRVASSSGATYFSVLASGSVGIGTSSPSSFLAIAQPDSTSTIPNALSVIGGSDLSINGNGGGFYFKGGNGGAGIGQGGSFTVVGGNNGSAAGGAISLTAGSGTGGCCGNGGGASFVLTGGVNSGGGGAVSITGGSSFNGFSGGNITLNGGSSGGSAGNIILANLQGKVGIGTTTVGSTLTVQGSGSSNPFSVASSTGTSLLVVSSTGDTSIGESSPSARLTVYNPTSSTSTDVFKVISDVSTTGNTVFKVTANGDIFTDGATTIGTPADLAENFPKSEPLDPGMLVSFASSTSEWSLGENSDSYHMSEVKRANYGESIIGVVSTRPGIVLGGNTVNGAPIALSGRVPVLVTTENGQITKGDYLTISSSTRGYAMRNDGNGYVIGKALSDASPDGTSTVLVLVNSEYRYRDVATLDGLSTYASSSYLYYKNHGTISSLLQSSLDRGERVIQEYISYAMKSVYGYFDYVFAKEVTAEKVCLKNSQGNDVCVNGDDLDTLLQSKSQPQGTTSSAPSSVLTTSSSTTEVTATTTDQGTSSSTQVTGTTTVEALPLLDPNQATSSEQTGIIDTVLGGQ
jgi:hypothetical protein